MMNQVNILPEGGRRSVEAQEDWQHIQAEQALMRKEEEKKMTPSMFDQMTRGPQEDPFPKFPSPGPGSNLFPSYPPTTPFGMLQQQALQHQLKDKDECPSNRQMRYRVIS